MDEIRKINFSVSGWPGGGATTLALILSVLFERSYLPIGQLFRSLGMKLGYANEGLGRIRFDNYIEEIIGHTVDMYTDYKLLNDNNLVIESDISSFRIGKHPKVFSIFLKADIKERINRVIGEGREQGEMVLESRDKQLKNVYQKLWQIDFFDEDLIQKKFNLLLDNSNMSLDNETTTIIKELKKYNSFTTLPATFWDELIAKIPGITETFTKKGKQGLLSILNSKNLILNPEDMLKDIAKTFPEDIRQFPDNISKIFLGLV